MLIKMGSVRKAFCYLLIISSLKSLYRLIPFTVFLTDHLLFWDAFQMKVLCILKKENREKMKLCESMLTHPGKEYTQPRSYLETNVT